MSEINVVVIGAGVAGLTSALLLSENKQYNITVAAKHMPGDYDIEYASPWAGANYMPVASAGSKDAKWEANTWASLERLSRLDKDAGVHFQGLKLYRRKGNVESATAKWLARLTEADPWWRTVLPGFQSIHERDLPPGIVSGSSCTSVCINTAVFLPWLVSKCLRNGVIFKRAIFNHLREAGKAGVHHTGNQADVVINCTGLGSLKLGGVEDKALYPIRGQIIVVRNDTGGSMYAVSGSSDASDETTYLMTRAAGGGTILGGCYQIGQSSSQPDPNMAKRIMQRCVELCPELTGGKGIEHLDIIRHGVGLRPAREGGARIEMEHIKGNNGFRQWVVHNYGHGGAGYQMSFGCAEEVVSLVQSIVPEKPRL